MIAFYRSVTIDSGKQVSAMAFAHEIAAYVRDKHGVDIRIGVPIGGNPNRVGWSAQYENLAALEASQTKMLSDPKYLELVAKGQQNFIPGTAYDEIWRIL